MKKTILFALAILGTAFAYALPDIGGVIGTGLMSLATLPAWFTMKGEVKTFKALSTEEAEKLNDADYAQYKDAEKASLEATIKTIKEGAATKEEMQKMQDEITSMYKKQAEDAEARMKKISEAMTLEIEKLKEQGIDKNSSEFESALKTAYDETIEDLKILKSGDSLEMVVKASQTYGDIDAGLDFAQFKPGITDIPVRKPVFKTLFSSIPLSTEFLKYTEQLTVLRNAQNVAKCSEVTSTTKETLKVSSIETKVIQDTIDFCTMFVSDYPFMASRINKLLNESIALRSDQQVLLGTGAGEQTNSIDSVSSEFSAANVACVLTTSIQAPNLIDLISGMATQIIELGEQNAYMPNVAIVNNCDWFKDVWSLKDQDDNYLETRVVIQGGVPYIISPSGLIRIVTSPLVAQNTCYVIDTTKGEMVDRSETKIAISYENKDNFVKHIGTILGWVRFNFLVENNNANAFMKCSDVGAAIIAITKP